MSEQIIDCPACGQRKASINTVKRVGQCFRATCGWKAGTAKLIRLGLVSPLGLTDLALQRNIEIPKGPLTLPDNCDNLVFKENGTFMTKYPVACTEVQKRGVSIEDQYRFQLHIDSQRIYIPIYSQGALVQYIGRSYWWYDSSYQRYKYAKGSSVTSYLFNWDECKSFDYLTIVENTFNAIRYRKLINSTSCFGSRLSKTQIQLIARSRCKFVILLLDEGAEGKAELAVRELRDSGVDAVRLKISGQPDDYSDDYILQLVQGVL